jgi:hypothetical protein
VKGRSAALAAALLIVPSPRRLQGRYFETMTRPGTYDYFCALHLEMRGRIVVEP